MKKLSQITDIDGPGELGTFIHFAMEGLRKRIAELREGNDRIRFYRATVSDLSATSRGQEMIAVNNAYREMNKPKAAQVRQSEYYSAFSRTKERILKDFRQLTDEERAEWV